MSDREARGSAIVGMAAVFPGAPDLARYWRNIERGVDAVGDLPHDRWDEGFYDPSSSAPDRLYCRRGGFLASPVPFDAAAFGIMPVAAEGAEPDQLLALSTAAAALADAGYADRSFARDRAAVIVGRGGYLTAGVARLDQRVRAGEQLARSLRVLLPDISEEQIAEVKADFQRQLGPAGADSAIGLVPNLAASRIANRLDLHGAAYTVDGACASSLLAVDHGCRELETRSSDLVIVGGVHLCHDPTFWSVFCQLGALSRSQAIRPFDRRADGLLIGEGVGMVVMKRLADAERDGDRIYAVVRGTGVSSDGRAASLMTPSVAGQLLALERGWKSAALDPSTVGLLEAHGTGTPAGDAAEVETLTRFFGRAEGGAGGRAVLGSVKSMIGHAMPAAGMAGLIKAALAIDSRTLPPTLHCDEPRRDLESTRFRPIAQAEPWHAEGGRCAAVNAFGFGGINAHVVLEEHAGRGATRSARVTSPSAADEQLALLCASSVAELAGAIDRGDLERRGDGTVRLAMFEPTPERRARAAKIVLRGEAWRGRDDIWFAPRGLLDDSGKVAFLFPGVDASFQPRVDDVAKAFDLKLPLPSASADLMDVGMGIIATGRILDAALRALEVRPDMIAGHSIGEWSAMIAAEMVGEREVDAILESLGGERVEVPGVAFVAVGAGVAKVLPAMEGLRSIALSHDNCPHQVILCGRDEDADEVVARLTRAGVLSQKLPFRSGYHSPLFADFVAPHRRVLGALGIVPPRAPIWSATTCRPYPAAPDDVRRLAIDHLLQPVRFRELTEALYADGARVFLQVGTGSLVGFVADTLRGRPHLALSANLPTRSGMAQLRRIAAALWVEGDAGPLERLEQRAPRRPARAPLSISLGVPLVTPTKPLARNRSQINHGAHGDACTDPDSPRRHGDAEIGHGEENIFENLRVRSPCLRVLRGSSGSGSALADELAAGFDELESARDEVLAAFARRASHAVEAPREARFSRRLSVDTHPELVDHTFYRQPNGWPVMEDRYPVVPMTMLMELMMDVAAEVVPHKTPIGLEHVRAARWLAVAPPVDVTIDAKYDGDRHVEVAIRGYAIGVVELDTGYPEAPLADASARHGAAVAPVSAAEMYGDRWMFHGPAYQGIVDVGVLAADGIRGTLTSLAAKGGLLDNAGQLLGYWVMQRTSVDRLAMPVHIARCSFFGPEPAPGTRLSCDVRVKELTDTQVRADVDLSHAGRVWCRIDDWSDRRFDSDERVWDVLRFPEQNVITVMRPEGFGWLQQPWRASASRDLLARRYLSERERAAMKQAGPRRQTSFLMERIALKDCVRQHLWESGHGPIFPIEIEVDEDGTGAPRVRGPFSGDLRVAVASHEAGVAAARVAVGRTVDVQIQRVTEAARGGFPVRAEVDGYQVGWRWT